MSEPQRRLHWYRSFYWRIVLSLLVVVIAVLVAQSVMFNYIMSMSRSAGPFPRRPPNVLATLIAADIGAALTQDPQLDLQAYVDREYGAVQPVYVVMKDGRVAANRPDAMSDDLRRSVDATLAGPNLEPELAPTTLAGPPVVMAPVQVANELRGLVVLPPRVPAGGPVARDLSRAFSIPGTLVLIAATALAAVFIFGSARRRLQDLEDAAQRLGAGDLAARAREEGGDEIAHLARAFNRMAGELAARDEALRTSDRLRRQMLADVSHELKTPLTAMRGFVETLRMPDITLDEPTRERYFTTLERETIRLDTIVKDLLDLARLENGVGTVEPRVFAIRRVFEHVVRRHEQELQTRRIAVTIDVSSAADQVLADPDRIEQVVENLVSNALRHTPDGGAIDLIAAADDGGVVLSVGDSGEGIPAEHLAHVFDRFYKVDSARANGSGGSGLGLSIAKAIVERHGGTIQVTSKTPGTVFTLTLPQADSAIDNS